MSQRVISTFGSRQGDGTRKASGFTNVHENTSWFETTSVYRSRACRPRACRFVDRIGSEPCGIFVSVRVAVKPRFVSDDATKPERVNTTKRQRAKRASAKFLSRWRFGGFNRAKRDLSRHRLSCVAPKALRASRIAAWRHLRSDRRTNRVPIPVQAPSPQSKCHWWESACPSP